MPSNLTRTRRIAQPMVAYFRMALVPGGWEVPCYIGREISGLWFAAIDEFVHPGNADPWIAEGVSTVHTQGLPITRAEYLWRLNVKKWARENHPTHPALNPHQRTTANDE